MVNNAHKLVQIEIFYTSYCYSPGGLLPFASVYSCLHYNAAVDMYAMELNKQSPSLLWNIVDAVWSNNLEV